MLLTRKTVSAGGASSSALVASLVPAARQIEATPVAPKVMPEKGGGYTLSAHVKQYYKTTLV